MQGNYVHKLTASYATHEGQRTARRRSPGGSAAASAAPASPGTRTIKGGHCLPPTCARLGGSHGLNVLPSALTSDFLHSVLSTSDFSLVCPHI